jgi:hypothetical protein
MKKLILILVTLSIICINGISQEAYKYPELNVNDRIKPLNERVDKLQIPDDLLVGFSDQQLIDAVLTYPLNMNFLFAADNSIKGMGFYMENVNVYQELLNRKEAIDGMLILKLDNYSIDVIAKNPGKMTDYANELFTLLCLVGRDEFNGNLNDSDKHSLVKRLHNIIVDMEKHPDVFGGLSLNMVCHPTAIILSDQTIPVTKETDSYVANCSHFSYNMIETVKSSCESYLKN